ncbi:MAG: molybdate ABC transporter substrate-binding protein [Chloroflexales bacterium]|nr:molybdate ABC transporter substrate-binding protein [Chloroflexales bacterium]
MSPRRQAPLTIEHALLGFVCAQPLHAYAVYQQLNAPDALGQVWQLKLSHFYALIAKLEQAGYLATTAEPQGSRPARKVLRLTEAGAAAFAHWRATPVEDPAQLRLDFLARLYFAERAGPATVRGLLIAQRAACQDWRDALRAQLTRRADQPDAGIFLQLRVRRLESFLAWIDRTLAAPAETAAVTYSITVVANSPQSDLAAQFVDYVRSSRGQAVLLSAGFSPTVEAFPERGPSREPGAVSAPARTLTVFAAASLTGPFEALGAEFSAAHPGTTVRFTFGGSRRLAEQLRQGAVADVFAPAHRHAMDLAIQAGRVWPESVYAFAANQLAVVTPRSNPGHLISLDDLARPGLKLALGSEATAVGQYTRELLTQIEGRGYFGAQGMDAVLHNVVRYGESVTEIMDTIARGEVDAGIVFASDGRQAGSAVQVPIALPALRPGR